MKQIMRGAIFLSALVGASVLYAQEAKISIVYTGKSMGALAVLRDPDEKELLQEEAIKKSIKPTLATHVCWRAPGIIVFDPEKDLAFTKLAEFLSANIAPTPIGDVSTLRSNNTTMLQYPENKADDLLALTLANPRASVDFPDLVASKATLSRARTPDGHDILILIENSAAWPQDPNAWTEGQVNRVGVGDSTVYELPVNLGEMGPRATLIEQAVSDAKAKGFTPLVFDLGERNGDFGLDQDKRAAIDYDALKSLGYGLILPYEFELSLGTKKLAALAKERSFLLVASNVKSSGTDIFLKNTIIEQGGVKVGLIGVVDPELKTKLSKTANAELTFEDPLDAVKRELKALQASKVNTIIMLSNLHPRDNALIAREVMGVDIILSDLHTRWAPESLTTQVELPDRPYSRPGSPALVARSFANGLGIGRLDLTFKTSTAGGFYLSNIGHSLTSVTDRTPAKTALVDEIRKKAATSGRPRGGMIFPAYEKLISQDAVLKKMADDKGVNRVTKSAWESFIAKLIRVRGGAEVSLIKRLDYFPPLVGDLDEANVRSWLWTEESLVILDITGKDLKAAIAADTKGTLAIDGAIDGKIHNLAISDTNFYRVITTDFVADSFAPFANGKRVKNKFEVKDGAIEPSDEGKTLMLRDYVISELYRINKDYPGPDALQEISKFLRAEDPYEPTFTFTFDHITVFGSYNQQPSNADGFTTLAESRANAPTSTIIGVTGNLRWSYDLRKTGTDFVISSAFGNQIIEDGDPATPDRTESSDDLKFDLKERFKLDPNLKWKPQPFLGATFDTEYTPTVQSDGTENPRQEDLSALGGLQLSPGHNITKLQIAAITTQSFGVGQTAPKVGANLETEFKKALPKLGKLSYRWVNTVNYFLVIPSPTENGLKLRYNMVHELLLPFLQDLSASMALDFLIFQGEVEATNDVGINAILRFGLTYDRFWKPKYQTLF